MKPDLKREIPSFRFVFCVSCLAEYFSHPPSCFLVTYFFLHKIIDGGSIGETTAAEEGAFVGDFGAYLQLHSCLTYAAMAKNESAIVQLLKAAKYDPNHVEAIKDIKNSRELVFYESVS